MIFSTEREINVHDIIWAGLSLIIRVGLCSLPPTWELFRGLPLCRMYFSALLDPLFAVSNIDFNT